MICHGSLPVPQASSATFLSHIATHARPAIDRPFQLGPVKIVVGGAGMHEEVLSSGSLVKNARVAMIVRSHRIISILPIVEVH